MTLDVVLLAGGSSRRMGADKALLEVEGETLLTRLTVRLGGLGGAVIVASGDGRRLPAARQVEDEPGIDGPLGGMLAGLAAAASEVVAIAAVDAPTPSPRLYERLARTCLDLDRAACMPVVAGQPEPLHSVIRRDALAALRALAAAGERSPRRALGRLDAVCVDVDGWLDLDPTASFGQDWDRPEDLPAGMPRP